MCVEGLVICTIRIFQGHIKLKNIIKLFLFKAPKEDIEEIRRKNTDNNIDEANKDQLHENLVEEDNDEEVVVEDKECSEAESKMIRQVSYNL